MLASQGPERKEKLRMAEESQDEESSLRDYWKKRGVTKKEGKKKREKKKKKKERKGKEEADGTDQDSESTLVLAEKGPSSNVEA